MEPKLNFWFLLLHPRRTLRMLRRGRDDAAEVERLNALAESLQGKCKQTQSAAEIAAAERDDLSERLEKTLLTVSTLTEQTLSLREKLDYYKETDRRLDEFMQQLEKFKDIREGYERRIRNMQAKIDNLAAALSSYEQCELDDPRPINMAAESRPASRPKNPRQENSQLNSRPKTQKKDPPRRESPDDSDWLQFLD